MFENLNFKDIIPGFLFLRGTAVKNQLIEFGTKPDIITLLDIEIQSKGEGNNFVEFIEVK